jgi:Spy/CpxP family protein refolding chaperone
LVLPAVLVAAPIAIGCGSSAESTTSSPQTASAVVKSAPATANARGPARMVGLALTNVTLRDDQRAQIEKLVADTEARVAPIESARHDLRLAIAAQVEAGAIDRAALQPKIDAVVSASAVAGPAHKAAMVELHAILDANQRAQFADALEAQIEAHHDAEQSEHAERHGRGDRMAEWAKDLSLTDAQKEQIKDAMHARFAAMRAQHAGDHKGEHEWKRSGEPHGPGAMLESFKSDTFAMPDHFGAPHGDPSAFVTKMVEHKLGFIETVLPILTPEQRTLAAQKIRSMTDEAGFEGMR